MVACRALVRMLPVLFLLNPAFAQASKAYPLEITVLSAEYRALDSGTPVPKDCDLQNFSAYCNESKNPTVQNIMRVQDGDGKSFSIACTVDSRWSKCSPLPVGKTFEASTDKHGITVLYRDAKGKERKELYQVLAAVPPTQPSAVAAPKPSAAAAPPAHPAATPPSSPAPTPAPSAIAAQQVSPEKVSEKVKCNFSSTPAGAEITLDGKYVGSTPSEIPLSAGAHVVVFSLPGFSDWKRELTVEAGSGVVNVAASLQKTQP